MILIILIPILIIYCLIKDGQYRDVKPFIVECEQWSPKYPRGEANGYLAIPKGHELEGYDPFKEWGGMEYSKVDIVHGGITWNQFDDRKENPFRPCYTIGFDTAHSGDNPQKWPTDKVRRYTNRWAMRVNNSHHPIYKLLP